MIKFNDPRNFYCDNCQTFAEDPLTGVHQDYCLPAEGEFIEIFNSVEHPVHYNSGKAICECGRKIECIDVTRHMDFNLGNAVKYIWRSEYKNGAEDIKKAIWYLNDYLTKLSTVSVEKSVNKSC